MMRAQWGLAESVYVVAVMHGGVVRCWALRARRRLMRVVARRCARVPLAGCAPGPRLNKTNARCAGLPRCAMPR